eukprot:m.97456 g.97456  ORF g.97456 m.97456 type:complete len:83 (-) comp14829_c0_seq3:224-472(-)
MLGCAHMHSFPSTFNPCLPFFVCLIVLETESHTWGYVVLFISSPASPFFALLPPSQVDGLDFVLFLFVSFFFFIFGPWFCLC